jgi:site-specific DNA-methyltransferase (cytosine-N4-specific)
MKKLIEDPAAFYKPAKRPSGHEIADRFGKDNGGAIPPNLLQIPNCESNGLYLTACKLAGAQPHPARFPTRLPEFFIRMLTDPGDLVVDIFAGSNTTGAVAEAERRQWLSFDVSLEYLAASAFRFIDNDVTPPMMKEIYNGILRGEPTDLRDFIQQGVLLEAHAGRSLTTNPAIIK